jgi:cyclophilin family peptidyl-prolyl cis-trans isomerase
MSSFNSKIFSVRLRAFSWLAALAVMAAATMPAAQANTFVRVQTSQGVIEIELFDNDAPITVANFLRYVRSGAYNNVFFHRSVQNFVIQTGGYRWNNSNGQVEGVASFGTIQNEFNVARSPLRGTVAMAKVGGDPNSATSEWFINLADNSSILNNQNGGFTVFGRLTPASLATMDAIAALPRFNLTGGNSSSPFGEVPLANYIAPAAVTRANLAIMNRVATRTVAPGVIDIDGNGQQEILVRSSGAAPQMRIGRLVGQQLQFTPIDDPGAAFRLVAAIDADGNGQSDLVFLNTTQGDRGDVRIWQNFDRTTERLLRQVRTVWDVQAVGDMDGDGKDDLVWRYLADDPRDTGVSFIWFTNTPDVPVVRKRGGAPLNWTLLGAADFNGDGAADMVYLSPDAQIRVLMATPQRTCANFATNPARVPTGFRALKLANFTGSGAGDLLIRNDAGITVVRPLSAPGVTLPPFTGNPDDPLVACTSTTQTITQDSFNLMENSPADPSWQLYATADLNADGFTDIVWLRPDGTLTVWLLNGRGAAPTVIANAGSAPSGFQVFQAGGSGARFPAQ